MNSRCYYRGNYRNANYIIGGSSVTKMKIGAKYIPCAHQTMMKKRGRNRNNYGNAIMRLFPWQKGWQEETVEAVSKVMSIEHLGLPSSSSQSSVDNNNGIFSAFQSVFNPRPYSRPLLSSNKNGKAPTDNMFPINATITPTTPTSIEHVGLPNKADDDTSINSTLPSSKHTNQNNIKDNGNGESSTTTTTTAQPAFINTFDYDRQNFKIKPWPLIEPKQRAATKAPISSSSKTKTTLSSLITNDQQYHPNATLTLADLKSILQMNGYVRFEDLPPSYSSRHAPTKTNGKTNKEDDDDESNDRYRVKPSRPLSKKGNTNIAISKQQSKKGRYGNDKNVAFPQPSTLSDDNIKAGTITSAAILGSVVGVSLAPNLWLIGFICGALYGQELSKEYSADDDDEEADDEDGATARQKSIVAKALFKSGRKLANFYLNLYDFFQYQWFIYKTGQLSYDYYKKYAVLDSKFQIQDKIDAWNARFQEGKKNFDKWEKENEVGRKVLAGIRTVWLVEEQRLKKGDKKYQKGESKYRIIRHTKATLSWVNKFMTALWCVLTRRGDDTNNGTSELTELLRGIRINLSQLGTQEITQRVGSALAALVLANFIGVMFAVAPAWLGVIAFGIGVVYPTWLSQTFSEIGDLLNDTRAKGRKGDEEEKGGGGMLSGMKTNEKYNFFVRKDGTKRWYRTQQPMVESNPLLRNFQQSDFFQFLQSLGKLEKQDSKAKNV
mmetsp:Transcript_50254/g.75672  ORF Transcript_50254/g.75672 Transcript_50254/m.75672 type:complete len:721 (-) Transcript_50254:93-2255(-)